MGRFALGSRTYHTPPYGLPMATAPSSTPRDRVLITGGGSGLGLALAQRYARDGAQLLIADLDAARAQAAVAGLPGGGHHAFQVDVGDDDSVTALKAQVEATVGGVDVLVNNAGIASGGPLLGTDMAEWRRLIAAAATSSARRASRGWPARPAS